MFTTIRLRRLATRGTALIATLAAILTGPGSARAETFGNLPMMPFSGVVVVRQELVPNARTEVGRVNLKPVLDRAWQNVREPATKKLVAELAKRRFAGQSLHHINLVLGTRGELLGNAGTLQYVIRGNRLSANITTPPVAFGIGFGSYADPRIAVDFDVYVTMRFAAGLRGITAHAVTVEVKASKPRGANFTGWLLQAVTDALKFVGGPDGRAVLRDLISSRKVDLTGGVNKALAPVNTALGKVGNTAGVQISPPGFANGVMTYRLYRVPTNATGPIIK